MKNIKMVLMVIGVGSVLLFGSCDDGSDLGTAPKILDAAFFPEGDYSGSRIVILTEGVTYDLLLELEDPDLDAYSCHLEETGPSDYYFENDIIMASQSSSIVTYLMGRGAPTPPYGAYQASMTITDEKGNESNTFRINYSIVSP